MNFTPEQIASGTTFLINKPLEWTSFDVVNKLKWTLKPYFKKIKIGHAGTLDPLAEGLLIVCTGSHTKTIESIQNQPKTYIAEIYIGATRPSFDRETEIDQTFDISNISQDEIEKALKSFEGEQVQYPPVFSAVKVGGKPAYLKARKGIDVEIKPRNYTVYEAEMLEINLPIVKVKLKVSKGTYIRSMADDFGKKLSNGAHLHHLVRTDIGAYSLNDAIEIETLVEELKQMTKNS